MERDEINFEFVGSGPCNGGHDEPFARSRQGAIKCEGLRGAHRELGNERGAVIQKFTDVMLAAKVMGVTRLARDVGAVIEPAVPHGVVVDFLQGHDMWLFTFEDFRDTGKIRAGVFCRLDQPPQPRARPCARFSVMTRMLRAAFGADSGAGENVDTSLSVVGGCERIFKSVTSGWPEATRRTGDAPEAAWTLRTRVRVL